MTTPLNGHDEPDTTHAAPHRAAPSSARSPGGRPGGSSPEQIVQAARQLGFTDLSLSRVTQRVGLTRSGFYVYFASIDGLRAALADDVLGELVAPRSDPGTGADGPPAWEDEGNPAWVESLEQMRRTLAEVLDAWPGLAVTLLTLPAVPAPLTAAVERVTDDLVAAGFEPPDATALVVLQVRSAITAAAGGALGLLGSPTPPALPDVVISALDQHLHNTGHRSHTPGSHTPGTGCTGGADRPAGPAGHDATAGGDDQR